MDVAIFRADVGAFVDRPVGPERPRTTADTPATMSTKSNCRQSARAIRTRFTCCHELGRLPVATCSDARGSISFTGAGIPRELRRHNRFGARSEFRAKAAAQILRDHAHFLGRQIEQYGEVVADGKDALGRTPYGKLVSIPFRDAAMSFERDVGLNGGGINRLDRVGGLLEAATDVAALEHFG